MGRKNKAVSDAPEPVPGTSEADGSLGATTESWGWKGKSEPKD